LLVPAGAAVDRSGWGTGREHRRPVSGPAGHTAADARARDAPPGFRPGLVDHRSAGLSAQAWTGCDPP